MGGALAASHVLISPQVRAARRRIAVSSGVP